MFVSVVGSLLNVYGKFSKVSGSFCELAKSYENFECLR